MATNNSTAVEQPTTTTNGARASTKTVGVTNGSSNHNKSMIAGVPSSSLVNGLNSSAAALVSLSSKPTLIEVKPMRFVIMDAPRQTNLHLYVKEMSKYQVHDLVRVCEPTYHGDSLQNAGITLHDMEYNDGHSPPPEIIEQWLQLVERTFYNPNNNNKTTNTTSTTTEDNNNTQPALAVHCVAGLGRAPVLVALALIEFAHMDPVEAVTLIRRNRRGAINEKQLIYLEGYKRRYKRQFKHSDASTSCNCIIM